MNYDPAAENLALLKRTIFGVGDFSGRSRRTEVVYFWIASALAAIIITFPLSWLISPTLGLVAYTLVQLILLIPTFALFVRRLHDQDRTGWWVLLYVAGVGFNLANMPLAATRTFEPLARTYFDYIALALAVGLIVLWFLPGTDGENGYGPDPREGG